MSSNERVPHSPLVARCEAALTALPSDSRHILHRLLSQPVVNAPDLCVRCCLRFSFTFGDASECYLLPESVLRRTIEEHLRAHYTDAVYRSAEPASCAVCLGALMYIDDNAFVDSVSQQISGAGFEDIRNFRVSVVLPMGEMARDSCMTVHLRVPADAPPRYLDQFAASYASVKDILRLLVRTLAPTDWHFEQQSFELDVQLTFEHAATESEHLVMRKHAVTKTLFKPGSARMGGSATRRAVAALKSDTLREVFTVPPTSVAERCTLGGVDGGGVTLAHDALYVGGYYRKLARNIPHSTWDGFATHSIEERIAPVVCAALRGDKCVFSSAGREDEDVRMLGRGRPFYMEVKGPKRGALALTDATMTAIAERINGDEQNAGVLEVRGVQALTRQQSKALNQSSASKEKLYRCLVEFERPVSEQELRAVADAIVREPLAQATPIRVLHRRSDMSRPRRVLHCEARLESPTYALFDFVTEAGLYVKELVHGDFGRTTPCISSLLGMKADLVWLDVMNVNFQFAKAQ